MKKTLKADPAIVARIQNALEIFGLLTSARSSARVPVRLIGRTAGLGPANRGSSPRPGVEQLVRKYRKCLRNIQYASEHPEVYYLHADSRERFAIDHILREINSMIPQDLQSR